MAGCVPRNAAMLFKQLVVAANWVYPGKAKNSREMLRSEGSTAFAEDGGLDGTLIAFPV